MRSGIMYKYLLVLTVALLHGVSETSGEGIGLAGHAVKKMQEKQEAMKEAKRSPLDVGAVPLITEQKGTVKIERKDEQAAAQLPKKGVKINETPEKYRVVSASNFENSIKEATVVLLEFMSPSCPHCKALVPELRETALELGRQEMDAVVAVVDVTERENRKLVGQHNVTKLPCVNLYRHGELVRQNIPARTGGELSQEVALLLSGNLEKVAEEGLWAYVKATEGDYASFVLLGEHEEHRQALSEVATGLPRHMELEKYNFAEMKAPSEDFLRAYGVEGLPALLAVQWTPDFGYSHKPGQRVPGMAHVLQGAALEGPRAIPEFVAAHLLVPLMRESPRMMNMAMEEQLKVVFVVVSPDFPPSDLASWALDLAPRIQHLRDQGYVFVRSTPEGGWARDFMFMLDIVPAHLPTVVVFDGGIRAIFSLLQQEELPVTIEGAAGVVQFIDRVARGEVKGLKFDETSKLERLYYMFIPQANQRKEMLRDGRLHKFLLTILLVVFTFRSVRRLYPVVVRWLQSAVEKIMNMLATPEENVYEGVEYPKYADDESDSSEEEDSEDSDEDEDEAS